MERTTTGLIRASPRLFICAWQHSRGNGICGLSPSLVPAVADPATGVVLHSGDQIGSFTTGWRFNQPDHEVIVKWAMLEPYSTDTESLFLILISIDESLPRGCMTLALPFQDKI